MTTSLATELRWIQVTTKYASTMLRIVEPITEVLQSCCDADPEHVDYVAAPFTPPVGSSLESRVDYLRRSVDEVYAIAASFQCYKYHIIRAVVNVRSVGALLVGLQAIQAWAPPANMIPSVSDPSHTFEDIVDELEGQIGKLWTAAARLENVLFRYVNLGPLSPIDKTVILM